MGYDSIHPVELRINSHPANLRTVRLEVESYARTAGLPSCDVDALGLVVNEAMANVIRHGYGNREDQPIVVRISSDENSMRIEIRDWGRRFDPSALPTKMCACENVDDIHPGGLGLICMRTLMDEVKFEPQEQGMLLTLIKRRPAPAIAAEKIS